MTTLNESSQAPASHCLLLTLEVPDYPAKDPRSKLMRQMPCVLSWNNVLQLQHNARSGLKLKIQNAFLSALRASESASSTKTTSVKSMWSIAVDTLVSYQKTALQKRKLRSANAKLKKAKLVGPS